MDDLKLQIGNKIRLLRKKRNVSQEELAARLDVRTSTLSSIETGKTFPSYSTFTKLCEVLEIHPKDLFDDPVTKKSENPEIIREINLILSELDKEKLLYIHGITKVFSKK